MSATIDLGSAGVWVRKYNKVPLRCDMLVGYIVASRLADSECPMGLRLARIDVAADVVRAALILENIGGVDCPCFHSPDRHTEDDCPVVICSKL